MNIQSPTTDSNALLSAAPRSLFKRRPQRASKRPVRRLRTDASRMGASAVEFAIVANIMMIMVLTCMEFARMNMVRNLAQDAAYFAARHAIVPGATAGEAVDEAERIMDSMVTNGYTVDVSDLNSEANDITVTVTVDFTAVAMFAPYFLPDSTITSTVRMRTERYEGFYEQ
ncbi:MAG: TadE/TadG family type IV pilus assembly protein [Rubripirellula sp.]